MSINQRFDVVFMAPADGATQIVFFHENRKPFALKKVLYVGVTRRGGYKCDQ